jgi:hypothetical protein
MHERRVAAGVRRRRVPAFETNVVLRNDFGDPVAELDSRWSSASSSSSMAGVITTVAPFSATTMSRTIASSAVTTSSSASPGATSNTDRIEC